MQYVGLSSRKDIKQTLQAKENQPMLHVAHIELSHIAKAIKELEALLHEATRTVVATTPTPVVPTLQHKLVQLEAFTAVGRSVEAAAEHFRVSIGTIRNWLLLIEATPTLRNAVVNELVPTTVGYKLATLPNELQAKALLAIAQVQNPSISDANRLVARIKQETD